MNSYSKLNCKKAKTTQTERWKENDEENFYKIVDFDILNHKTVSNAS